MDPVLQQLSRAQDAFHNALSVGMSEMKSAHDAVAKEAHAFEKARADEREAARNQRDHDANERRNLELKLTQCEEALKETKRVLLETREAAKDVRG